MRDERASHPLATGQAPLERRGDSLADVLERVLDKGVVIAGDIRVDLLDIELLTIRIRLLVSSADKAQELGMAWWRNDPFFAGEAVPSADAEPTQDGRHDADAADALSRLADNTDELLRRLDALEARTPDESVQPTDATGDEAG